MSDISPIANAATGPGGLFSNPALGGGRPKRRSKSAQRRVEKAQQVYKSVQVDPEAHPGAMIALMLSPEQQAGITEGIPGKLVQEADHCTLLYLAEDASKIEDRKAALLSTLAVLARLECPIEVAINGYGAFAGSEDQYPLVLLLNSPRLPWLRQALYMRAMGIGIPIEDKHGFTPHITLSYLPASQPMPRFERKNTLLKFDSISLIWAGERIDLPLLGKEPDQSQFAGETMEDLPRSAKAQQTFGGTKRADLPDSAFLDPGRRSFPVKTAQDVRDAVSSWGRYRGSMTFEQFKRKLTRRARAIGAADALPESWKANRREKARARSSGASMPPPAIDDSAAGAERLKMAPIEPQGWVSYKPFASRAQQRWAFSTSQPFAERWADETGDTAAFRRLPNKVARKSKSAQRRIGLLDPAEMERAEKAGERIAGQLCRSDTGRFVNCNSAQATQESKDKLKKAARDQKKQETAAERDAATAASLASVGDVLNANDDERLSKAGLEQLQAFAENGDVSPDDFKHFEKYGLAQTDRDGVTSLTAEGRRVLAAARKGDADAVGRALDDAGKRAVGSAARQAARDERRQAIEARRAEREAKRQGKLQGKDGEATDPAKAGEDKKPKKAGGGGGGGGKKEEPEKEEPEKEGKPLTEAERREQERALQRLREFANTYSRRKTVDQLTVHDLLVALKAGYSAAQLRAIHAKGGGGGGGGGGGKGGKGGGITTAWAQGSDGRRHPTTDQKAMRVEALQAQHSSAVARLSATKPGTKAHASAQSRVNRINGKIKATNDRPSLEQVNQRVRQQRTDRLNARAQQARRAANSGMVTESQRARLNTKADRLEARARGEKVGPREKPNELFGREYQQRQAELRNRPERIGMRGNREQFFGQQVGAPLSTRGSNYQTTVSPERVARMRADEAAWQQRAEARRARVIQQEGSTETARPATPATLDTSRLRATEDATSRVRVSTGWDAPASERQQSYLRDLTARARTNTRENSAQRAVADELTTHIPKLTKWEASQLIDAMREPKPFTTLTGQAHAAAKARRGGGNETSRQPTRGEAMFALPSFRSSLIGRILDDDAVAEEVPF